MFPVKVASLMVIIFLSACSVLNPEIGYLPMKNESKSSIDSWIIDGKTTKDQINARLGYYRDDFNPVMTETMRCKPDSKACSFGVYVSHDYFRCVTVSFDDQGVVKSHTFTEKPVD